MAICTQYFVDLFETSIPSSLFLFQFSTTSLMQVEGRVFHQCCPSVFITNPWSTFKHPFFVQRHRRRRASYRFESNSDNFLLISSTESSSIAILLFGRYTLILSPNFPESFSSFPNSSCLLGKRLLSANVSFPFCFINALYF